MAMTIGRAITPFDAFEAMTDQSHTAPDIMEFVVSDKYLDRPNIYPRQGTLLKIIFLQDDLFTEYDHHVIGEWIQAYQDSADETGEGNTGIVPDVYERIKMCKADGRRWFREVVMAGGRRGSKGHIGGISGANVLWNYILRGDVQGYYGVDRDKQLIGQVFAGKKEQARAHQWGDIRNVILGSNCFAPYVSRALGENLTIYSRYDQVRMLERSSKNIKSADDMATFQIEPRESTGMAGRGGAAFMQFYDEMAHVVAATAKADAGVVYDAATPALDQFKPDEFIYLPSSPWQKIGKFRERYLAGLEVEPDGTPTNYNVLVVQFASWDLYKDWEIANQLRVTADGPRFLPLKNAIQTYDDEMRRLERANPETFRVERRAHFAAVMDAYLNPDRIREMWEPWPKEAPVNIDLSNSEKTSISSHRGLLAKTYRAHGDPSKSGANFGFVIGHIEGVDDRGLPHVVFDLIHSWQPMDFEGNEIDYDKVGEDLMDFMDRFMPTEVTFDQFNSVATIQQLQRHARAARYPKSVTIYERTATGPLNWKTYETFKTALGLGLLHGPKHVLADLELQFLQDLGGKVEHPTSGPVQTKDVADCMAIVVFELIGDAMSALVGKTLQDLTLHAGVPGGVQPFGNQMGEEAHQSLSNFGRGHRRRR